VPSTVKSAIPCFRFALTWALAGRSVPCAPSPLYASRSATSPTTTSGSGPRSNLANQPWFHRSDANETDYCEKGRALLPPRACRTIPIHLRSPGCTGRSRTVLRLAWLVPVIALSGCAGTAEWTPVLTPPDEAPARHEIKHPLKVHLHSGELLVLRRWEVSDAGVLEGNGDRYDVHRRRVGVGELRLPLDSVALFESSVPSNRLSAGYGGGTIAIAILGTITGAITLACLADPKSCFGSCPTFYVDGPDGEELVAEGFSASFARVLEERDVDAMPGVRASGGRFEVTMRNEAMETHAIRSVRILATPRKPGGRVVRTPDGHFFTTERWLPPVECLAAEGDCLEAVSVRDGVEWRSWADPTDLASREVIELTFPATEGPVAVVLTARHSLLSTFLFYQNLAYLGSGVGEAFAALERGNPVLQEAVTAPIRELGRLNVEVLDEDGEWRRAGTFSEAGPLASDQQAIVLPVDRREGPAHVRLDLVQGYWRIDEVALVSVSAATEPVALPPTEAIRGGKADPEALARLLDPSVHLHTYPGVEFVLAFDLPEGGSDAFELFLESEGYYYEWMRPEWLAEEDPAMVARSLSQPEEMFRLLAPEFKKRELEMDELFWQSRFRGRQP